MALNVRVEITDYAGISLLQGRVYKGHILFKNDLEQKKSNAIFALPNLGNGSVVQLVRMPPCHGGGRGFESRRVRTNWTTPVERYRGFYFKPMGTHLKVGLIGAGYLGKIHLANWKEIEQVELIGFYDPNPETAASISKEFSIPSFVTGEELIDACDAIDITAPTNHHLVWCEKAIRKGKHVFVEKPLAASLEEARMIVALTRESGVKLQVGHVERFNPAYLAVKDLSLQPLFIEVHRLAQFNPRGTEVSVILDLMIHDIDIILSLVKSDIKQISASGVAVLTDTPDIANARIEFHNGCVANLTSSRISMKKMRKIRLFQKDAYIGIDFLDKKTEVIKLKGEEEEENAFTFDIETHAGVKTIAISSPEIPAVNAIQSELISFRDAILENSRPMVSETDGMLAMDVAHQIIEKINQQLVRL